MYNYELRVYNILLFCMYLALKVCMYIESHVVVGLCQNPYYDPGGRVWGFVNFACPMGGEFDNQLGQIPILAPSWPHPGPVG